MMLEPLHVDDEMMRARLNRATGRARAAYTLLLDALPVDRARRERTWRALEDERLDLVKRIATGQADGVTLTATDVYGTYVGLPRLDKDTAR